jgi:putative MATE family efflux protein
MPELGAVGSAWGTFLARMVGCAIMLYVLWRGVNGVSIRGTDGWLPDFTLARQMLKIGVPAATEQMLNSVAFLVMSIVVAQLGTYALAAHRIALNAMSLSFLPGLGFGLAATALVGQSIGARRYGEGQAVATISTQGALIWMSALGVIFFFFGDAVMRLFTTDPQIIEAGAAAMRPMALTQPLWAITMVQSGALRGTGDTQYPLRVGSTNIWLAVLIGGLGVRWLGGGLAVVWGSFMLTAPITAFLLWRRVRRTLSEEKLAVVSP